MNSSRSNKILLENKSLFLLLMLASENIRTIRFMPTDMLLSWNGNSFNVFNAWIQVSISVNHYCKDTTKINCKTFRKILFFHIFDRKEVFGCFLKFCRTQTSSLKGYTGKGLVWSFRQCYAISIIIEQCLCGFSINLWKFEMTCRN